MNFDPIPPVVKVAHGEAWVMALGDSLGWLTLCPAHRFDAVVTDPPYSSGGAMRGDRVSHPSKKYVTHGTQLSSATFDGDNRDGRSFLAWATLWLTQAHRTSKPGAPVCVFTDWRQLPTVTDAVQAGGWVWRGIAPWTKPRARPQMGRFRQSSEFVVWGSRGPLPLRRDVGVLEGHWDVSPIQASKRHHIAEKPVRLMEHVLGIVPAGGLVLDPFAGSASTGVACLATGRRFMGLESDPEIFEAACERLREAEKQGKAA